MSDYSIYEKFLNDEQGAYRKPYGLKYNIAVLFPDKYEVAMAHLGFQTLYRYFNEDPEFNCERYFSDKRFPKSLENQRSLNEFDLIIVTVPFELGYWNLMGLLDANNIPLHRKDRVRKKYPYILTGGVATWINHRPIANISDAVIKGELELLGTKLLEITRTYLHTDQLIEQLKSNLPNVYTTMEDPPITFAKTLNHQQIYSQIETPNNEFRNKFLIEVTRGCPYNCSFCYLGNHCTHFRQQDWEPIHKLLEQHKDFPTGIISSATGKWKHFDKLLDYIEQAEKSFSFSSLRIEDLNDRMLEILSNNGQKSLTIAPETGDEELRFSVKKKIRDEVIFKTIDRIFSKGFNQIKLYFLIGLPGENEKTLANTREFLLKLNQKANEWCKKTKILKKMQLSFGIFVPKPQTPLASYPLLAPKDLKSRLNYLKKSAKQCKHISFQWDTPKNYYLQYLFSNYENCLIELYQEYRGQKNPPQKAIEHYLGRLKK